VRAAQVLEKEGAALQKPYDRIDQVSEEDRESKDQKYASCSAENCEQEGKVKDSEENVRSLAIRECHILGASRR
jgi:hypothetical protein